MGSDAQPGSPHMTAFVWGRETALQCGLFQLGCEDPRCASAGLFAVCHRMPFRVARPPGSVLAVIMPSNVSMLLSAIQRGEFVAADQLLPLVYDQLREMARANVGTPPACWVMCV